MILQSGDVHQVHGPDGQVCQAEFVKLVCSHRARRQWSCLQAVTWTETLLLRYCALLLSPASQLMFTVVKTAGSALHRIEPGILREYMARRVYVQQNPVFSSSKTVSLRHHASPATESGGPASRPLSHWTAD